MKLRSVVGGGCALAALAAVSSERFMGWALRSAFGPGALYPLSSPAELLAQHLSLALGASLAAASLGFVLGIIASMAGDEAKRLVMAAGALAQTMPPVAVLALAVPVLGFGSRPVFVALALYGILPVLHGTATGLNSVPPASKDAAVGMGMGRSFRFLRIELPLALPAIVAGLRSSVVINVGTAAIGAAMGAGGLGRPIMAGLVQFKTSYVAQGAVAAMVLALSLDWALARIERAVTRA